MYRADRWMSEFRPTRIRSDPGWNEGHEGGTVWPWMNSRSTPLTGQILVILSALRQHSPDNPGV